MAGCLVLCVHSPEGLGVMVTHCTGTDAGASGILLNCPTDEGASGILLNCPETFLF